MRFALYCPIYGYYESDKDRIGTRGDYYTNASAGPLFGQLLAFQFCTWFAEIEKALGERRLVLVEAGAHDGGLGQDILTWIKSHRPALFEHLEYCIIEPSPRRQAWQKATLAEFSKTVHWTGSIPENTGTVVGMPSTPEPTLLTLPGAYTIVFSNELLDAMPTHRVGWDARNNNWFEWGVRSEDGRFIWEKMPLTPELRNGTSIAERFQITPELQSVLPDGFTTEICLEAARWWRAAAGMVSAGRLLTFDYGLEGEEFFAPHRSCGTMRGYYRHHLIEDLLARPGDQDLTSQVNFSALRQEGEGRGLRTEFFGTQDQFLTRAFSGLLKDSAAGARTWDRDKAGQFQTLTHPDHLGRAFLVLVQARTELT